MEHSIFKWFTNEALLQEVIAGLPTVALLGLIAVSILLLSRGADWMIDGVVNLAGAPVLDKRWSKKSGSVGILAAQYGISTSQVWRIAHGRAWKKLR